MNGQRPESALLQALTNMRDNGAISGPEYAVLAEQAKRLGSEIERLEGALRFLATGANNMRTVARHALWPDGEPESPAPGSVSVGLPERTHK